MCKENQPSIFFADFIDDLTRPDWANVKCRNHKTGRCCYAYQNKQGKLFTGLAFGEDDFQYDLEEGQWLVKEL